MFFVFFFERDVTHLDLHVPSPPFPTRLSSDLVTPEAMASSICCGQMKWICASTPPAVTILPSPAMISVPGPMMISTPGWMSGFPDIQRSEEHTSELPSLMRISYAVFCLKNKKMIHTQPIKQSATSETNI